MRLKYSEHRAGVCAVVVVGGLEAQARRGEMEAGLEVKNTHITVELHNF